MRKMPTLEEIQEIVENNAEIQNIKEELKDKANVYIASNIYNLSTAFCNKLEAGDAVLKRSGSSPHYYYHTYIVSFRKDNEGMCLTYTDAGYIETVSYDLSGSSWVYNSTDIKRVSTKYEVDAFYNAIPSDNVAKLEVGDVITAKNSYGDKIAFVVYAKTDSICNLTAAENRGANETLITSAKYVYATDTWQVNSVDEFNTADAGGAELYLHHISAYVNSSTTKIFLDIYLPSSTEFTTSSLKQYFTDNIVGVICTGGCNGNPPAGLYGRMFSTQNGIFLEGYYFEPSATSNFTLQVSAFNYCSDKVFRIL